MPSFPHFPLFSLLLPCLCPCPYPCHFPYPACVPAYTPTLAHTPALAPARARARARAPAPTCSPAPAPAPASACTPTCASAPTPAPCQANYTRVSALSHTTLVSVQLLLCFSIPVVLVLSWLVLKSRYQLSHIFGLVAGVMSVVAIVWLDVRDGKGGVTMGGGERLLGDMLALLSAALAGVSQVDSLSLSLLTPMPGGCGPHSTGLPPLRVPGCAGPLGIHHHFRPGGYNRRKILALNPDS